MSADPRPSIDGDRYVRAPWSGEQVANLNGYQEAGIMHPFTCAKGSHTLRATPGGWVCDQDDYTQDWAHKFMADGSWKAAKADFDRLLRG